MPDDKEKITRRNFRYGAASIIAGVSMLNDEVMSNRAAQI